MSARIPKQNKGGSKPPRSKMSVLTIAFAIAMAFFLVIGMVAVGVTELVGGNDSQPIAQNEVPESIEQQGESEEDELRARIDEDEEDYSAHSQLAVMLGNTGRVDEAIPHFEAALGDDPDDEELRLNFARALEQRGYDLDAEIQLERVLESDEENVEAMYLLGQLKERSQPPDEEEAASLYEQIIDNDPDSFFAEMAEERLNEIESSDAEDVEQSNEDEEPDGQPGSDDGDDAD